MRLLRHLRQHLLPHASRRVFPEAALRRIADAVAAGERSHRGEVCFAVESALPLADVLRGLQARDRAHAAFARLRVWDTAANNGVLVFLLLADRRIEIVADRGLAGLVDDGQWREVCAAMEARLRAGEPEAAAIAGVEAVSALLARHFPRAAGEADDNELPDRPHLLD